MQIPLNTRPYLSLLSVLLLAASAASCSTTETGPVCELGARHHLDAAFKSAKASLRSGCAMYFDDYMAELLIVAEGDPQADNKRRFSEFLVWASEEGLLSRRQAQNLYNRYFNVKFVSLRGDYNNCAHTCPLKQKVLYDMEDELSDKELGLLKVSLDRESYYRADQLFQETELVLEATCTACAAGR